MPNNENSQLKELTTMKTLLVLLAIAIPFTASAAVQEVAHYSLKGAGGIRDIAAPEIWKSLVPGGPDLARQGSPKVMSNGPESRRQEYDSCVKFEEPDQCYNIAKNLVDGDNFVVEAWAYALKGRRRRLAHRGRQRPRRHRLHPGAIGRRLGGPRRRSRFHHARESAAGDLDASGDREVGRGGYWLGQRQEDVRTARLGRRGQNFSIGATAPGKEAFHGWVAEVRYSTFKPGQFDPAADFLLDTKKLKAIQAAEMAERAKLVESLLATPGVLKVTKFDEHPASADWLITPPTTPATVQVLPGEKNQSARIMLANGLISRTFLVTDGNLGCISLRRSDKDLEFVRAIKPEVRVRLNGGGWTEIGGLTGAPDHAFITPAWFEIAAIQARRFPAVTA